MGKRKCFYCGKEIDVGYHCNNKECEEGANMGLEKEKKVAKNAL